MAEVSKHPFLHLMIYMIKIFTFYNVDLTNNTVERYEGVRKQGGGVNIEIQRCNTWKCFFLQHLMSMYNVPALYHAKVEWVGLSSPILFKNRGSCHLAPLLLSLCTVYIVLSIMHCNFTFLIALVNGQWSTSTQWYLHYTNLYYNTLCCLKG